MNAGIAVQHEYVFAANERPLLPGSPATPYHPIGRRIAYVLVALIAGISGTLGNALVTVNTTALQGALGLYITEISVLPAIYVAMNACANLFLVKARMEFGVQPIVVVLLVLYAAAAFGQLLVPGFASAIIVRGTSGLAAGCLTTISILYMFQIFPAPLRPLGVLFGVGIPQLGSPLARLFPTELLALNQWRGLYLIECGTALAALIAVSLFRLPPSDRQKAFERLDALTIVLLVPAVMLLCLSLGEGRLQWWTEAPWIGYALATSIALIATAIVIERHRTNPLLQTHWLASGDIVRFAVVALLVRFALAEQTYGAVGLLTFGGLNNEQLHTLFAMVILAMIAGSFASAVTLSPTRIPYQVLFAALLIALGAGMDSVATNLTRPSQLILSQSLIGFSAILFLGPALLFGFIRMLALGPNFLVSLVVTFSLTQNIGGLAGSALLGTYQVIREKVHSHAIIDRLAVADPAVAARVQEGSNTISSVVSDPMLRGAEGFVLLARSATQEANILAYNDVFRLVMIVALSIAAFIALLIVRRAIIDRPRPVR